MNKSSYFDKFTPANIKKKKAGLFSLSQNP